MMSSSANWQLLVSLPLLNLWDWILEVTSDLMESQSFHLAKAKVCAGTRQYLTHTVKLQSYHQPSLLDLLPTRLRKERTFTINALQTDSGSLQSQLKQQECMAKKQKSSSLN